MKNALKISKSAVAKMAGLALATVLTISFIGLSHADTFHQLTVNVNDVCGPVVAQATIVNGPDDGAFGITNANGQFIFTLHAGVFYVHVAAAGHNSRDTGTIVLNSDQSITVTLDRTSGECPTPSFVNLNFLVKNTCSNPIVGASVNIDQDFGNGTNRTTDGSGFANFGVYQNRTIGWTVSASGYSSSSGSVNSGTSDKTVNMILNGSCGPTPTPTPTPIPPPPPAPGVISIAKNVRNVTQGQTIFTPSIAADPNDNDTVEFQIPVTAFNGPVSNVVFSDQLPNRLTYVNNSLTVDGTASGNNLTNLSLGNFTSGQTKTVLFGATIASANQFPTGSTILTNTATVTSDSNSDSDTANVVIEIIAPPPGTIDIQKRVRNLSDDQSVYTESVAADPNEQVEFELVITASINQVDNVAVTDQLPNRLSFVPNSFCIRVNNMNNCDNRTSFGTADLGDILPNSPVTITFKANVASAQSFPSNATTILVNTAILTSSVGNDSDTAQVLVTVTAPPPGTITVSKVVRNVTMGQTTFTPSTTANPLDILEFQMPVTASNGAVTNVVFSDQLPSRLTYVNNSLTVDSTASGNNLSNLALGNFISGQTKTVIFRATVNDSAQFNPGSTTLTNFVNVTSNSNSNSASANVVVNVLQTNPTLSISKLVRNISQNQSSFVKSTQANPNEQVMYQIQVTATGNAAITNVVVTDNLPNNFTLTSGSNTTNLGTINAGITQTVTFTVQLASEGNFPTGSSIWINTATATSGNAGSHQDTANVVVTRNIITPPNPFLNLTKEVRNLTTGSGFSNFANAGNFDRVEFRLVVRNDSSSTATNVRVSDFIPNGLTWTSGSFQNNSTEFVGTLTPGQSRTIYFQTTVNSTTSQTIVNSANVTADNANSVNAQASVFVSAISGNINLVLSKRAFNQTQNVDATAVSAQPGDVVVYTLRVQNSGNATASNFIIQDDLADVLQLAMLQSFGDALFNLSQLSLSWPVVTVPVGGSIEKTFSVIVNATAPAASDNVMTNVYGNTINVRVASVRGVFIAPPTGSGSTVSLILAFATVLGYVGIRKSRFAHLIKKLILRNNA